MTRESAIALIGVHGYGAAHVANIRRLAGRARLIAAADPAPPVPGELPEETRVFTTLTALLDATDHIDVVIVATPLHTHAELAHAVVERGIDLYLEKPPVLTRAALQSLSDAAAGSGARVQVGFQSLGSEALTAFAEDRFGLGAVRSIGAVGLWRRDDAYWSRSRWAGRRELDGIPVVDGVSTNPLAHATATALAIAGAVTDNDVSQVTADLYHANPIEGDDTSIVRVSTTRGVRVTAGLTLCAQEESAPYVDVHGVRGSARFFYTEDIVELADQQHRFGRTDLLENLLDHRDHGAALLAPLHETGAFVRVVDTIGRTVAQPIARSHVEIHGDGPGRHRVIPGIQDDIVRAVDAEATFAELHLPWARQSDALPLAALPSQDDPLALLHDGSTAARSSSPRPYLHPVRTPGGVVVTDHHPADHDWHLGVGVALQDVDGVNFWGGRTYARDEGYIWRQDHGRIDIERQSQDRSGLVLDTRWVGPDGAVVLRERRTIAVAHRGEDALVLELSSTLTPSDDRTVRLGSPGSNGRHGAGYGGLMWRLPACSAVTVRTPDASGEQAVHGSRSPWLALSARFETGGDATVAMAGIDDASAADPWFVRVKDYPGIGASLAAQRPVEASPSTPLRRAYRLLVADGRLTDDRVVELLHRSDTP